MSNLLKDKYFVTGLFLILLFSLVWISFNMEEKNDGDIEGVVYDIRKTENGFVFMTDLSDGNTQKCFFNEKPESMMVYRMKGSFSEDGNIFFVKNMVRVEYK